jgi:hypothetical protein
MLAGANIALERVSAGPMPGRMSKMKNRSSVRRVKYSEVWPRPMGSQCFIYALRMAVKVGIVRDRDDAANVS